MAMISRISLLFLVFLAVALPAHATTNWTIIQITDNDSSDIDPVVNDTHVAWLGRTDNREVYVYDGDTINQLTNSSFNEQNLFASDRYIAWNWRDGVTGDDIFLYDGITVEQITNTTTNQFRPKVHGERMVWTRSVNDVILYDIASGTSSQLIAPGGTGNELDPWIYGNWVSFTSNEGDSEIYYYDIAQNEIHQLTDNGLSDYGSKINDDYIAYIHYDGNDREVMIYDRATMSTTQLSDNTVHDGTPNLNGDHLVWTSNTGGYAELYLYNASTNTTQLIAANTTFYVDTPSIDGNLVVYQGHDGNDWEIYIYEIDSGVTTQLTNNDYHDGSPMVRGQRIVWTYYDGPSEEDGDNEIMLATPASGTPVCDIKANGSDGPVGLTLGDTLSVTIELDPGIYPGIQADWWCAADTPFGWYYYDDTGTWLSGFEVSYQGPLFDLTPPLEVLSISGLPIGGYTFYFGVDGNRNGNLDEPLYYDSVEVNITP
jgi:Tol biopolymer transport system component